MVTGFQESISRKSGRRRVGYRQNTIGGLRHCQNHDRDAPQAGQWRAQEGETIDRPCEGMDAGSDLGRVEECQYMICSEWLEERQHEREGNAGLTD